MNYIRLFFIGLLMFLFTTNFFGQIKTNNIQTINGKKYYKHKVEKKQTLYSISKLYNVALEDIYKLNPELKAGLKADQEIIIPFADQTINNLKHENSKLSSEVIDTLKFITYKTIKNETLFSISKKFNVSEEVIYELNPLIRNGLKEGQLLILGEKINKNNIILDYVDNKTSLEADKRENKKVDSVLIRPIVKTKKTKYKITLILPFNLDQTLALDMNTLAKSYESFPKKSEIAIDFYLGFKYAIKSLNKKGFNINLVLFNFDNKDSLSLIKLSNNINFKESDMIFGPLFASEFKVISQKAKEYNIPIISPITQQNKILYDNIYTSKTNPSQFTLIESLADYCLDSLANQNANIVLLSAPEKDKKEVEFVKAFKIRYNEKQKKLLKTKIDSLHIVNGLAGLKNSYIPHRKNVFIILSNNQALISNHINQLALFSNKKKIILCGLESTTFFDNLDQNYLNQMSYTFPFQYDLSAINNKNDNKIIASYIEEQGTFPSENYFIGYDIATYYLKHLRDDGPEFIHQLDKLPSVSNYIRFNFFRPDSTTGFDNRGSYIFKYNNYELIKTGWK